MMAESASQPCPHSHFRRALCACPSIYQPAWIAGYEPLMPGPMARSLAGTFARDLQG